MFIGSNSHGMRSFGVRLALLLVLVCGGWVGTVRSRTGPGFAGPGFLLPTRNAELFRWCLNNGLRVVHP
jgi:hypothetical protein